MDKSDILYESAVKCRDNSYSPYSGFAVGAAILAENGKIYAGCNVENSSYPCGTCAEAGAIAAMIAGGAKKIVQILIVADTAHLLPCGNCLQKIAEFCAEDALILCADLQKNIRKYRLNDLLMEAFSAKDMENV